MWKQIQAHTLNYKVISLGLKRPSNCHRFSLSVCTRNGPIFHLKSSKELIIRFRSNFDLLLGWNALGQKLKIFTWVASFSRAEKITLEDSLNEDTIDGILSGQLQITKRVFAKIFTSQHNQNFNTYMISQFSSVFIGHHWLLSAWACTFIYHKMKIEVKAL